MEGSKETARECAEKYLRELEDLAAQCADDRESAWILALLRSEMKRTRSELAQIILAEKAGDSRQTLNPAER